MPLTGHNRPAPPAITKPTKIMRTRNRVTSTLHSQYKTNEDLLIQVAGESDHPSVQKALQTLYELTRLTHGERYGDLQRRRDRIVEFDKSAKEALLGQFPPPGVRVLPLTLKQKIAIVAIRLLTPLLNSIREDQRKPKRMVSDDETSASEASSGP